MSKSLGTGIDPLDVIAKHGADGTRFGLLAMSSTQDVRFSEEKVAPGPPARQQAVQRDAARAAARGRRGRAGRRAAAAGGRRGRLDPLAPAASEGRHGARDRGVRVPPRRARALRLRLRRAVRLVPGDRQAAAVRGRQPRRQPLRARRHRRDARDRPPGDPVRDRGALVAHPGRGGAADGPPLAGRGRVADRPRGRGRAGPRDRRRAGAARLARPDRRGAGRRAARAAGGRRLRAHGRARRAARPLRVVARRRRSRGDRRGAGRHGRRAPVRGGRPRQPRPRGSTSGAAGWSPRSRGPRRSSPTRASWPRRRRRWWTPSATSWPGCARSTRRCDVVGRSRARSTCSGSSCSACASAWSACGGC